MKFLFRFPGVFMEFYGVSMEFHARSMELPLNSMGVYAGFLEFPWVYKEFHGPLPIH